MSILEMQVNALMRLCLAEQESEQQRAKQELRALLRQYGPQTLDPEDAIRQILLNLGGNAVKYAAPGTPIQLDAVRQGSRAVLTVTNRGEDIPADKLPHIFDRFYRADEARTDGSSFGLGLAIAKAIVDAHRGTIRCESGGGVTRFIISLPLAAGKQERGTDHV